MLPEQRPNHPASLNAYSHESVLLDLAKQRTTAQQYLDKFETYVATGKEAVICGRIMALRRIGKISFIQLQDESGKVQIVLDAQFLPNYREISEVLDLGQIILARGKPVITKSGAQSLGADFLAQIASCSTHLADKFHGLTDIHTRRSERVLELLSNRDTFEFLKNSSIFVSSLRQGLLRRQFLEFETPILRRKFAAGVARPFFTSHIAWGKSAYLRLTSEVELKQLIIAGYPNVFEIGKSFRNEGVDKIHNPEFTLLEAYQAYSNYQDMMKLTEELISEAILGSFGTLEFVVQGHKVDFGQTWHVVEAEDVFREFCGKGVSEIPDLESAQEVARKLGIDMRGLTYGQAISKLLEGVIQPQMVYPTFIAHLPIQMSPLTKALPEKPWISERAWAFAGGVFYCDIYSDLTDAEELLTRLRKQDRELETASSTQHADNDLVSALRFGMPPSAGMGLSINRILLILGGKSHIMDTIPFPNV